MAVVDGEEGRLLAVGLVAEREDARVGVLHSCTGAKARAHRLESARASAGEVPAHHGSPPAGLQRAGSGEQTSTWAERERGELLTEPPALHLADGPREPAGAGDMVSEVRSRANRCLLEAAGRRGERWPRRGEGQLVLSHRRREWRRERARRQTHRSSAPSCVCLSCTGSERVWPMVVEVREEGDDEASCGGQGASWTGRRAMVLQGELGAGCWLA